MNRTSSMHRVGRCVVVLVAAACAAHAASFDQRDTFSGGTTENWSGGAGSGGSTPPPAYVASGGPMGSGYGYMLLQTSGFHLGAYNTSQWSGDYIGQGILAVEMDLNHIDPGSDDVRCRLLLFGPGGTFASRERTPPVETNSWSRYVFGLSSDDMVHVQGGTGLLEDTLSQVSRLLLRHDRETPTVPGSHPPHITAKLGVDNIHAVPRQPSVSQARVEGEEFALTLADLVPARTNVVQTTDDLTVGTWSDSAAFVASTPTTNLVVRADADAAFIRLLVR